MSALTDIIPRFRHKIILFSDFFLTFLLLFLTCQTDSDVLDLFNISETRCQIGINHAMQPCILEKRISSNGLAESQN